MERFCRFVILFPLSMAGVFVGASLANILGITDYEVILAAIGGGVILSLAALYINHLISYALVEHNGTRLSPSNSNREESRYSGPSTIRCWILRRKIK